MTETPRRSLSELSSPYAASVASLKGDVSMRTFAREVGIDPSTVSRLLSPGDHWRVPTNSTHEHLIRFAITRDRKVEATALEDAWRQLSGKPPENEFERVFGREIARGQVSLVIPMSVINENLLPDEIRRIRAEGRLTDPIYVKPTSRESADMGMNVVQVAKSDVEAMFATVRLLSQNGSWPAAFQSDEEYVATNVGLRSALCFGLYSNLMTAKYANSPDAIFGVHASRQPCPRHGDTCPGELIVDGMVFANPKPADYPTYFVISRTFPNYPSYQDRVLLVCAGVNGNATTAAADYLADDWRWFSRLPSTAEFAAVFRVNSAGAEPHLEHLKTRLAGAGSAPAIWTSA